MENSLSNPYSRKAITASLSRVMKRIFDVAVSIIALVFLAPLFGLIALALRRDSKGPIFYGGRRVGKDGQDFKIWKFRTMFEEEKSYRGPRVTAKGDPRITPLGKWLRDTKLNELPQFWNVLKGDMSLVGPRPEDPSFARTWPAAMRDEILSMKPGITSPATIVYHDEESILNRKHLLQQYIKEIGPDKLRLDQMYIRHHSFVLDLDILLWTALILVPKIRSNTPPEELLFVGPMTRLIKRYMNWASLDLIVTFIVMGLTVLYWRSVSPIGAGIVQAITMTFIFSLIFSFSGAVMGINKINWSKASPYNILNLLPAWTVASTLSVVINAVLGVLPNGLVVLASVFSLTGYITTRYSRRVLAGLMSRIRKNSDGISKRCEPVVILGSGRTAEHVCTLLDHPSNVDKFEVVGIVDDDLFTQGMSIYGKKVLGRAKDLSRILDRYDVRFLFLASHTLSAEEEIKITKLCSHHDVRAVVIPDIFGSIHKLYEESKQDSKENGHQKSHYMMCLSCKEDMSRVDVREEALPEIK